MNEDVFPIENRDFPVSHVSFQGWYIWGVEWFPHFPQRLPLIPETSRCLHRLFWRSSTQRGSTQRHKHQPTYQLAIRRWWRPWQDLQKPLELEATHILSHTYCTVCTCIYNYIYIHIMFIIYILLTSKKTLRLLICFSTFPFPTENLTQKRKAGAPMENSRASSWAKSWKMARHRWGLTSDAELRIHIPVARVMIHLTFQTVISYGCMSKLGTFKFHVWDSR